MNHLQLIRLWQKSWNRIVISQLAPTGLLITTVALMQFGLGQSGLLVRIAADLILLASGILGALAQYSAATEAQALAALLAKEGSAAADVSPALASINGLSKLLWIVKFVTPAVFVAIFAAISYFLLG
ncbi:MAG: hypothetical protein ACKOWI_03790 [Rhodoluna sp.]